MANATVKTVSTVAEKMSFYKKYLELATGRKFIRVQDNASKFEEDGNAYSYLLQLGDGNASTRFQTWITARKDVRVDMYIGNAYIDTETVTLDISGVIKDNVVALKDYCKSNDNGKGNAFKNVPLWLVEKFYRENALCVTPTTAKNNTVKKSESVAV